MNSRLYSFGINSNADPLTSNKLNSKISFKNLDRTQNDLNKSFVSKNQQGSTSQPDNYSFKGAAPANQSVQLSTVSEVKVPHEFHINETFRPAVSVKLAEKMSFQNPDNGKDNTSKKGFKSPNNKNSINPSAIGSVSFNPGSIFAPEKGSIFVKSPHNG